MGGGSRGLDAEDGAYAQILYMFCSLILLFSDVLVAVLVVHLRPQEFRILPAPIVFR